MKAPLNIDVTPTAAPLIARLADCITPLETERLLLRVPRLADWAVLEPIWTSERGKYIGGPMNAEDAWLDFSHLVASWILRGFGGLTILRKSDDTVIGLVLIEHEMGDPEPELGWLLTEDAEGHGYALEAASAMMPMARDLFGSGGFVSYIHQDNSRSIRLAEKLGAKADQDRHPGFAEGLVFRHGGQS